ncbi:hypothetical protein, partial [Vibrio vulnificus]|uniref:hypothetical protein n=1 Tax=Vibrio vulnificus TaxID=672 RepID=UPI001F39A881
HCYFCDIAQGGFESRPLRHLFRNPVFGLGFVVFSMMNFSFKGILLAHVRVESSTAYTNLGN